MRRVVKLAMKDVKKNYTSIIFFVFQLTFCIIFSAVIITDIVQLLFYQKTYHKVMNFETTAFNVYYSHNDAKQDEEAQIDDSGIRKIFEEDRAFSFLDNVGIDKYEGVPVIVGVGAFDKVYGYNSSSEISVWKGSYLKDIAVGDEFTIGNTSAVIGGSLPYGTSFFRKGYLYRLDDCILMLMSYSKFESLFPENEMESYETVIRSNLYLLNADSREIDTITQELNSTPQIKVIPINYNNYLSEQYNNHKKYTYFYTCIIISALIFIAYGILINLLNLVDKNLIEYTVNILCGATLKDIFLRNFFYIFMFFCPSVLVSFYIINKMGLLAFNVSILLQIEAILLISILVSFVPYFRIHKNNLVNNLRRDY